MGWQNPPVPWSELERRLSDGPPTRSNTREPQGRDGANWSRKRELYEVPEGSHKPPGVVPYAELHVHSNFSFLDGASDPEVLVEEAVRLGLDALALTDRNGFYGVVRFAEAARAHGLSTVFGAELSLTDSTNPFGQIGSAGDLVILARGPEGYGRLGRAISEGQMAGEKAAPRYHLDRLGELADGE